MKKAGSNDQDSATSTTQSTSESNTDSTITSKSSSKKIGWLNLHYNLSNCKLTNDNALQDLVLLDSDSTNAICCNEGYLENIRDTETPLKIQFNGGMLTVT